MAKEDLEEVIKSKVKPILDKAMHRCLGITVAEINSDITDKILKSPLFLLDVDQSLPLRQARDCFRKYYLTKVLRLHFGNISEAAKTCGLERRSLHRLINKLNIDVESFRREMLKESYVNISDVQSIISGTLNNYKSVIQPEKLKVMHEYVPKLSEEIRLNLPESVMQLKDAEHIFEKEFIQHSLEQANFSISKAAKALGLRYETLHRKIKLLGITMNKGQ